MKKKILSQLMILSFAFAGLFLIGNNVMGNSGTISDLDDNPIAIMCHQEALPGRLNFCYFRRDNCWQYPITEWCVWSGWMENKCFI